MLGGAQMLRKSAKQQAAAAETAASAPAATQEPENLTHLLRVDPNEKLTVEVRVELKGTAPGALGVA